MRRRTKTMLGDPAPWSPGSGFPTLIPTGGIEALTVVDVDGVTVSGLTFDAGTTTSPVLMSIGRAGVHTDHAANPISVSDVFFRIGSSVQGKATTTLVVHADDTIIDHIWAWRADHGGAPTGWTLNTGDTGLIVNGDDVLATGLFVEHYQKYEVIWNGNRGRTIFFQNETVRRAEPGRLDRPQRTQRVRRVQGRRQRH